MIPMLTFVTLDHRLTVIIGCSTATFNHPYFSTLRHIAITIFYSTNSHPPSPLQIFSNFNHPKGRRHMIYFADFVSSKPFYYGIRWI
ncbi:hypothetical protein ACFX2C_003100 [Malus domestica]